VKTAVAVVDTAGAGVVVVAAAAVAVVAATAVAVAVMVAAEAVATDRQIRSNGVVPTSTPGIYRCARADGARALRWFERWCSVVFSEWPYLLNLFNQGGRPRMNPKHFHTPVSTRTRCPVCHQPVYSRGGIHPQCAMRQSEPALHEPELPEEMIEDGPNAVVAVAAIVPAIRAPKVRPAAASLRVKAVH
jgi:hypothetical protein